MAEAGGGGTAGAWKRFSGKGNNAGADYKTWRRWVTAKIAVEVRRGLPKEAVGPMVYTLLDDEAERAVEHIDIHDLEAEDGEQMLFTVLDERFPDKEASDRIGEALESVFGLSIERNETSQSYTGRARTLFGTARKEGVDLPPVAQGFLLLRGARLGSERRAIVLAASQRQWGFNEIAAALRTTYPRQMPTTNVHEASAWPDDEPEKQAAVAEPRRDDDDNYDIETEINEILADGDEPIDEEDAIDILATWKETRAAMNKEKLQRGFKPVNREAFTKLEMRNRCFLCKRTGHFSRQCPMRRNRGGPGSNTSMTTPPPPRSSGSSTRSAGMVTVHVMTAPVETDEEDVWQEIDTLLTSWSNGRPVLGERDGQATLITKLTNAERFRRLARERDGNDMTDENENDQMDVHEVDDTAGNQFVENGGQSEDEFEVCACHSPGCGAVDTGCGMCLIGSETLTKHMEVSGDAPEWISDAPTVKFKAYDGKVRKSNKACWITWHLRRASKRIRIMTYVIDGDAGLLISKPILKMLGAHLDMESDKLHLAKLNITVPLREAAGSGHYEIDLMDKYQAEDLKKETMQLDERRLRIEEDSSEKPSFQ
jgi:hypothetical protein